MLSSVDWINISLPTQENTQVEVFNGSNKYKAVTLRSLYYFEACYPVFQPVYTYTIYINDTLIMTKSASSPKYYQSYSLPTPNIADKLIINVSYNGAYIRNFVPTTRLGLWT